MANKNYMIVLGNADGETGAGTILNDVEDLTKMEIEVFDNETRQSLFGGAHLTMADIVELVKTYVLKK